MKTGMGSHQSGRMINDEWLTPLPLIKKLGDFDLDPCAPIIRPWDTAKKHYTIEDDGLNQIWHGRVWCNPPYGNKSKEWLKRMFAHQSGTALIFARTETKMFFDWVWKAADAVLFIEGRLTFCDVNGIPAKANSGAPSVLVAYGVEEAYILKNSGVEGKFIRL